MGLSNPFTFPAKVNGQFEKGLVVGTVLRVAEPVGLFREVWVRPSASPAFAEQVFVSLAGHNLGGHNKDKGLVPLP